MAIDEAGLDEGADELEILTLAADKFRGACHVPLARSIAASRSMSTSTGLSINSTHRLTHVLVIGEVSRARRWSRFAGDIRTHHFPCGHDHSRDTAYNDLAWLTGGVPV